jgi:hypothetical protein
VPVSVNFDPLLTRMQKLRVSQELIARLLGFPPTMISRAANHQVDLSYPDWRKVEAVIADLEELVRRAGGVLLDWKNHEILKIKLAELEDERRNPPAFPSHEDYKLMQAIGTNSGVSFVDVAQQMGCTVSELLKLLEDANKRFAYMGHRMSSWTNARAAHVDLVEKELEERKALRF